MPNVDGAVAPIAVQTPFDREGEKVTAHEVVPPAILVTENADDDPTREGDPLPQDPSVGVTEGVTHVAGLSVRLPFVS